VLVSYDAFGLFDEIAPKFVKRYAHLGDQMIAAAKQYITEVEQGEFPDPEHSFRFPASTATRE
jgi:3-methyl-2-oxobutanoate hydroxymethyltransferase